jgi:hypothetical protein
MSRGIEVRTEERNGLNIITCKCDLGRCIAFGTGEKGLVQESLMEECYNPNLSRTKAKVKIEKDK